MSQLKRYHVTLLLAAAAAALPLLLRSDYQLSLVTTICLNIIIVVGLNLLMGYAGQVSLGQAAFVGVGAYTSAILTTKLGLSPWLALAAGLPLGGLIGVIVGIPLLKLRGHYLAMGTLGFGMIANIVLVQWEGLTAGTVGIMSIPPLALGHFSLESELGMYLFVVAVTLLSLTLAANIIDSRVGRAMRAVHGSEIAAETSGVDTAKYKLQVFALSAALAALAGSLYGHHASYISPDTFGFHYSIQLVVMAVLGGLASIWGAVFGAAAVTLILEHLRQFQEFSSILFGGMLIVVMVFLPGGLWRGVGDIFGRLGRLRARRGRRGR